MNVTFTVPWEGPSGIEEKEVEIKKLSLGKLGDIKTKAISRRMSGNDVEVRVNEKVMYVETLMACVVKAPFDIKRHIIESDDFPADVGMIIYNKITELANVEPKNPIASETQ